MTEEKETLHFTPSKDGPYGLCDPHILGPFSSNRSEVGCEVCLAKLKINSAPSLENPVDLQDWFSVSRPDDNLIYAKGFVRQVMFVRDSIADGLFGTKAVVISTHRSKSVLLPVYVIDRKDLGLTIVLRDNFYNWKLSVMSQRPALADFTGLFKVVPPFEPEYSGNPLSPVYFEGFPKCLVFGYYATSDWRVWSAEIWGDNPLWTALFLLLKSVGGIRPAQWHTKEGHRKELDERAARRAAQ